MLFFTQETQKKQRRTFNSMEKYLEELCGEMREIYKLMMKRIREEGKLLETDVLFMRLYKTKIEQNTNYKE